MYLVTKKPPNKTPSKNSVLSIVKLTIRSSLTGCHRHGLRRRDSHRCLRHCWRAQPSWCSVPGEGTPQFGWLHSSHAWRENLQRSKFPPWKWGRWSWQKAPRCWDYRKAKRMTGGSKRPSASGGRRGGSARSVQRHTRETNVVRFDKNILFIYFLIFSWFFSIVFFFTMRLTGLSVKDGRILLKTTTS